MGLAGSGTAGAELAFTWAEVTVVMGEVSWGELAASGLSWQWYYWG